jgi:hypothetical protein
MKKEQDNMKLWDQVCTTDPDTTRRVTQRGGFTAIDAQAQLKRATEVFGPYGTEWGLYQLVYHTLRDGEGSIMEMNLTALFKYPGGEFPMSSSMRYRPGDDCHKKLLTDLRSKCLSTLGFNSDVFEGRFDDNKYVENLKGQKQQEDTYNRAKAAIHECDDAERLKNLREHYCKRGLSIELVEKLDELYEKQKTHLSGSEVNA